MPTDFNHPLVGRAVVYRDPYRPAPEQGIVTSVNIEANLVFVRYGAGSTNAATAADERLSFLDGKPVTLGGEVMELDPCPWCGKQPQLESRPGDSKWVVYCQEVCTVSAITHPQETEDDAIAAWNRRALTASRSGETGWRLVPVEPTWEMLQAMYEAMFMDKWDGTQAVMVGAGYDAALAAASSTTQEPKP